MATARAVRAETPTSGDEADEADEPLGERVGWAELWYESAAPSRCPGRSGDEHAMISFEHAKVLLAEQGGGAATSRALAEALSTGAAAPMSSSPGGGSADSLARDFEIRRRSATRAGLEVAGLDEVLQALNTSPEDASVTLFHFRTQGELFSLFIRDEDERILGAFRLVIRPHETRTSA